MEPAEIAFAVLNDLVNVSSKGQPGVEEDAENANNLLLWYGIARNAEVKRYWKKMEGESLALCGVELLAPQHGPFRDAVNFLLGSCLCFIKVVA